MTPSGIYRRFQLDNEQRMFEVRIKQLALVSLGFLAACGSTPTKEIRVSEEIPSVELSSLKLRVMSEDKFSEMIKRRIQKAQDIQSQQDVGPDVVIEALPEAVNHLQTALQLVLARPDSDGLRSSFFARLRRELTDLGVIGRVIDNIVDHDLNNLKNEKNTTESRHTSLTSLNNLLSEMKPEIETQADFARATDKIRDAKIKIDKTLSNFIRVKSMTRLKSPSALAKEIKPGK